MEKLKTINFYKSESLFWNSVACATIQVIIIVIQRFIDVLILGDIVNEWLNTNTEHYGKVIISRRMGYGSFSFHRNENTDEDSPAQELDLSYLVSNVLFSAFLICSLMFIILGTL